MSLLYAHLSNLGQTCHNHKPHETNHRVHICNGCLIPPEYLSPRITIQREPGAKLLNQLIAATGIEYIHIVPTYTYSTNTFLLEPMKQL